MFIQDGTVDDLAKLYATCDDNAGHHLVVVHKTGRVEILELGDRQPPRSPNPQYLFWRETYARGNGYVGPIAAADHDYMAGEFAYLKQHWDRRSQDLVDWTVQPNQPAKHP